MADSRFISVRNAFISGLLLLAPLAVTWVVFRWLVDNVGGAFRPLFFFFVPENLLDHRTWVIVWNILATGLVLIFITVLGYVSRLFLGKYLLGVAERALQNVPGISAVYNTVKQIVDTFSTQNRNLFTKVVLVEFPRPRSYAIGFLTNKTRGEAQARTNEEVWTVFVPTTPNPTSGFLVMFPKDDIVPLDMSVGDGMKFVISGGTVIPPWPTANGAGVVVKNPDLPPPAASGPGNKDS